MHWHRRLAFAAVAFDSHVTPLLADRARLASCPPDPPENLLARHASTAVDILSISSGEVSTEVDALGVRFNNYAAS
jgi:hypothetical protein